MKTQINYYIKIQQIKHIPSYFIKITSTKHLYLKNLYILIIIYEFSSLHYFKIRKKCDT